MSQFDRDFFHGLLTFKRGHDTPSELDFNQKLQDAILDLGHDVAVDSIGNQWVTIGESRSLFTCHVDTCHRTSGMQTVVFHEDRFITAHGATECLGADDGAGILVLLRMIEARVPGTYAFFRGEERGGIGSRHAAEASIDMLSNFDRAVAFDRGGYTDVITHQGGTRCCSDAFGEALATALCEQGLLFMPSDHGVYTDTAELTHLIPECTNISVGYSKQHGPGEVQVWSHLDDLCNAVVAIDWEALPTERKAEEDSTDYAWGWMGMPDKPATDMTEAELAAIEKAMDGDHADLKLMVAQILYPESPEMAMRHISFDDLSTLDWEDVLDLGIGHLADICEYTV